MNQKLFADPDIEGNIKLCIIVGKRSYSSQDAC